jgi:hypothetical protein
VKASAVRPQESSSTVGRHWKPCQLPDVAIDRCNGREHGNTRREEAAHGGRQTGDSFTCPGGLRDECRAQRARGKRAPNTTAKPRGWFSSMTRWSTNFLLAMINE